MDNDDLLEIPPFLDRRTSEEINKSGDVGGQPTHDTPLSEGTGNIGTSDMQPHPYADMFPLMQDDDLAALVVSIRTDGLEEPIVTYKREILDGRNRYTACTKAEVEPAFVEYKGTEKTFPSMASGFEIETELTIHCLDLKLPAGEVLTPYKSRPEGSLSKLLSIRDGLCIFGAIVSLLKDNRPLFFFTIWFAALAAVSIGMAAPLLFTYLEVGLVPRFPTAILSTGILLLAFLSLSCGFILDNVAQGRREKKLLSYLALSSVREALNS